MRHLFALVLLLSAPAAPLAAWAGDRVALVIGNAGYRHVEHLANPGNDARLIARTLQRLGFRLVGGGPLMDADKVHMDAAVHEFGRAIAGADVALFYYSGHGLQVDGENWLVPVDANPERPQDLDFQMTSASLVLRQMTGAGTRLNIVLLDACRNNPFGTRGLRGTVMGLAQMQAPEGTLISYATQPGAAALDGAGADSPYSSALAQEMSRPGQGLFETFNAVGLAVKRATGGAQQPWVSSSPIEGRFSFAGDTAAPQQQQQAVLAPIPTPQTGPARSTGAPWDGHYTGFALSADTHNCAPVQIRLQVTDSEISGVATLFSARFGTMDSDVHGRVGTDGQAAVAAAQRDGHGWWGSFTGQFSASGFAAQFHGTKCEREIKLSRQ